MRSLICLAAVLAVLSAGSAYSVVAVKGDLNGDGKANKTDARLILRILSRGGATPTQQASADVNGDGKVDMRDVRILLKRT